MNFISKLLFGHLILHYLINLGTVIFINPENVISIGLHQKVGNCHETEPVHTILKVFSQLLFYCNFVDLITNPFFALQTLERKKYLCVDDYDEKYYDFHCLPDGKVPQEGSIWYTVCGTPYAYVNRNPIPFWTLFKGSAS